MRTIYKDMDIHFSVDGVSIQALSIIFERFTRIIPSHSHGNGCYEIHYIPYGYGKLTAENREYRITPNTLYVTGPHVEHSQTPVPQDPMQEYCVYLKIRPGSPRRTDPSVLAPFIETPFWFGSDTQGIHGLMKQLFDELEHQYTGYMNQAELLLSQLLILLVRSYEQKKYSPGHFARNNLSDSKSVIIEEYFLYEYHSLSLETLSGRLGLSTRQTQRLLQEYYGKSFQQKKTEARMSAAAILLREPNRSISSIAEALGYATAEHFSGAFRSYYHISPREYRRLHPSDDI